MSDCKVINFSERRAAKVMAEADTPVPLEWFDDGNTLWTDAEVVCHAIMAGIELDLLYQQRFDDMGKIDILVPWSHWSDWTESIESISKEWVDAGHLSEPQFSSLVTKGACFWGRRYQQATFGDRFNIKL